MDAVGLGAAVVFGHAILAHAHRHDGGVKLAAGLNDARKGDVLAVAEEVFARHDLVGFRLVLSVEVDDAQPFGIDGAVAKEDVGGDALVRVDGRGGDDVLAPRAVGGGAVVGVAACLVGIARLRIEGVGEAGALCTVVVLEVEEVLLAIIDPVGAALRLQAITHSGQRAAVQVVGGHKVGAAVVATGLGGDDVAAHRLRAGFIRIAGFVAGRYGIVTVTASSHQATGQKGCGQSPCELFFLHMRIIINGL